MIKFLMTTSSGAEYLDMPESIFVQFLAQDMDGITLDGIDYYLRSDIEHHARLLVRSDPDGGGGQIMPFFPVPE